MTLDLDPSLVVAGAAVLWLAILNVGAASAFAADKRRAVLGVSRYSEKELLALVVLGGGVGAWAAMLLYRHKTSKQPFQRRFRAIVAVQAMVAIGVVAWIVGTT